MTKRHYELFAQAVREARFESVDEKVDFVTKIIKFCQEDNPLFDEAKFLDAVYGEFDLKKAVKNFKWG